MSVPGEVSRRGTSPWTEGTSLTRLSLIFFIVFYLRSEKIIGWNIHCRYWRRYQTVFIHPFKSDVSSLPLICSHTHTSSPLVTHGKIPILYPYYFHPVLKKIFQLEFFNTTFGEWRLLECYCIPVYWYKNLRTSSVFTPKDFEVGVIKVPFGEDRCEEDPVIDRESSEYRSLSGTTIIIIWGR